MLSCVPKLSLLGDQIAIGLLVMSDYFCIIGLFLAVCPPSLTKAIFILTYEVFILPLLPSQFSSPSHHREARGRGAKRVRQDTGWRLNWSGGIYPQ